MCGVTGVYSVFENGSDLLYKTLKNIQHRGQDSHGYSNGEIVEKKMGLIQKPSIDIAGNCLVGHTRYRTSGSVGLKESQPLRSGKITIVHNGNIENQGDITDTYYLLNMINNGLVKDDILTVIKNIVKNIEGAFFIILIFDGKLYAFKDRRGIRPGGYWEEKNSKIVSSERVGDKYSDIYPGEIIILGEKTEKIKFAEYTPSPCIFEYIYFASQESTIYELSVQEFRTKIAIDSVSLLPKDIVFDAVIGVPKTARLYGEKISEILDIPYLEPIRNMVDRSFIMPTQEERDSYVRKKFSFPSTLFKKSVLVVDDSIIRGTISKHIVSELRKGGVEYICFLSCSPMVVNTNPYGINITSKDELISYNRDVQGIKDRIGVDSLVYQNISSLYNYSGFKNLELSIFTC